MAGYQLPSWAVHDRWSDHQLPIFEEIIARYDEGNSLVVLDAPTGSGKTIIAEMVRQELGVSGVYLCTSLTLQSQFATDFPDAKLIMGRANYPPQLTDPDPWGNTPTCADCDRTDNLCSYCPDVDTCPYTLAKLRAADADLACTNTAYFMGECQSPRSMFSGQPFTILDEADMAEGEIMRHVTVSISPRMQKLLELRSPRYKTKQDSWEEWFDYAVPKVERKLQSIPTHSLMDRRNHQRVERLLARMKDVQGNLDGWIMTGYERDGAIEFKPITVDKLAPKVLWKHSRRWLAMSATIISPEEFVQSLGYEGSWAPVFAPSTFPADRRPIYYCPSAYMTKKQEETERPKMAKALQVVLDRHPDERVLVHTHSYMNTNFLQGQLNGGRPTFYYLNSHDRADAIANFEQTDGAVLLAPSLDRGYDGKDDIVRVVVLTKLMWPYLGDKQVSARLYSTKGGQLWYATLTARSIVQSVGRAMRHEDDHCTIYCLDSMMGKFYRDWQLSERSENGGRRHLLFPNWFLDALHWDSDVRWEVSKEMKKVKV